MNKVRLLLLALIVCCVATVYAQSDDLDMGTPARGTVYQRAGYALGFDASYGQAAWVSYKLTAEEVCNREVDRKRFEFKPDPKISNSASKKDYPDSKQFQRGHLAPAADMRWSEQAMEDCFFYSNTSPQRPAFNTGIWSKLETVVRNMAVDLGSVYVITGPVLNGDLPATRPDGNLSVPQYFYKAVLYQDGRNSKAIGFVLANEGSSQPVQQFAVTVDSVEQLTGLDFFSQLPDSLEDRVEGSINLNAWTFDTRSPCTKSSRKANKVHK